MKRVVSLLIAAVLCAGALALTACGKERALRSRYEIDLTYEEESGTLHGEMNFTYCNDTETEISQLKFNLFGNAFREGATLKPVSALYSAAAYYNGESYGQISVENVAGNVSEWDIAGTDENILTVTLAESVFPAEACEVQIGFALELAQVNHRTGITAHTVNLGNFYPQLCAYDNGFYECEYNAAGDPFYSQCADYTVTLTADSDYAAAASGRLVRERERGHDTERQYALENARDFSLVLSKEFQVLTEDWNGITVAYYYYNDEDAQSSLRTAVQSLTCFSQTFGGYPYQTYSAVQTGFCFGGMEYPGLTMISDNLDSINRQYTIVHETAHQWWYAAVGNNQIENSWMDEGLTEYSCVLYFENYPEYGLTRQALVKSAYESYKQFFDLYGQLFGETNTAMNRKLSEYGSEYEYVNIAYNKGIILFDNLRESLGDKKFKNALKRYFAEYCFDVAKPEDMIACFEKIGVDVAGFFASYIEGKAVI